MKKLIKTIQMIYQGAQMIPLELMKRMMKDRTVRTAITRSSHWYFFHFYFAHYVKYPTATFHREIFDLSEDESKGNFFIVAFRGSSKSTILTTSYPIWAILGKQQKKFVLILCQTMGQAKQHMMNLRSELESNALLKSDLGPFKEIADEWGSVSLVFSRSGARITVASSEQSIRGLRHHQYRPDLIIGDDVEDLSSTKTREGRNKTYQWLKSEVIPTGDRNTRLVMVGNLLHEDSLLMRIKEDIEIGGMSGLFKEYPLIKDGRILWPGKYSNMEEIEKEKLKAGDEYAWRREYLLEIVPEEDQVIYIEWINYYDVIPPPLKLSGGYLSRQEVWIGIDPAISKNDTADYTAIIPGLLYELPDGKYRIYILPKIINKRMSFPETIETCKVMNESYCMNNIYPTFIVEDVGYQKALPQQLISEGILKVKTTRPGNQDKHSRILLTGNKIKNAEVLFPRVGAERLIEQLVHFGAEKNDDLADAFANLVHSVSENPPRPVRFYPL